MKINPRPMNTYYWPDAKDEKSIMLENLYGGLNLWELDYRLSYKESPEMKNLFWLDGALNCRDGQTWLQEETTYGTGYAMYDKLYYDKAFVHIGTKLYYFSLPDENESVTYTELFSGVPEIRGTFFQYFDNLYYKTKGAYIKIGYDSDTTPQFTAAEVEGFVPTVLINANPAVAGAGDDYQPENRISSGKTVWFNAVSNTTVYHLPVTEIDSVDKVIVSGAEKAETTDYTVDLTAGTVTFVTAPPVTVPPTNNTVKITYSKENTEANKSIDDCRYVIVYGGASGVAIVMAGSEAQPNAYFWNGNNTAMDATYFPMVQFQLAGDSEDAITGFGKQQSLLVVFKERSLGRTALETETIDGREYLDMPYTAINSVMGCDLPWSIRLVNNNLVWCNTQRGVMCLKDSSAAYENTVADMSKKVNGTDTVQGLLHDLRSVADKDVVCSGDDGTHYWLVADGKAWVWDYEVSDYRNPSWFPFTNIKAKAFLHWLDKTYHLDGSGRMTLFERTFLDYGEAIDKVYRFATQFFYSYDRVKNVNSVVLTVRSDTNSETTLTYITDYEIRDDLTPLRAWSWRLDPRNLAMRALNVSRFGSVFRRRPMCRRVKHFTMKLTNNTAGQDLSVVSAQIFYNYQGRQR